MHAAPSSLQLADAPACERGDDLGELFRDYSGYVAAVALRLLGRDADVDDVVQDVFLAALRGVRGVRDPGAIKGWLATVTVRNARRKLKRRRLRTFLGLDSATDHVNIAVSASQDKALMITRAYEVLDGLPVDVKIAWLMRHAEGESLDAVATMCGCSLATAKRRIAAAQSALHEELGA